MKIPTTIPEEPIISKPITPQEQALRTSALKVLGYDGNQTKLDAIKATLVVRFQKGGPLKGFHSVEEVDALERLIHELSIKQDLMQTMLEGLFQARQALKTPDDKVGIPDRETTPDGGAKLAKMQADILRRAAAAGKLPGTLMDAKPRNETKLN